MSDSPDDHQHFTDIGENVGYDDSVREYFIVVENHGGGVIERQALVFCPICGKCFPTSLRQEWLARLEDMGIDPLNDVIPEPYRNGSWWRVAS
jgi:hypothetical protein